MKKSLLILGAFFLALLTNPSAIAQSSCGCTTTGNQIINGDFSAGNTGFTSSLPFDMNCNAESYGVGAEARDKCNNSQWANDLWDHTVGNSTGSYMIVDAWNNTNSNMIWSTTSTVNVVAGQDYVFSFWQVRGISSTASTQTLEMRVGGATIATVSTVGAPQLGWTEYCTTWTATTTGTVSVSIWQTGSYNGNQDYGIDDIYFGTCSLPCEVNANFNPVSSPDGCTYDFTSFVNTNSSTTVVGYSWTFGDGYSSTDANPTHTYNGSGVYTVCLTVYAINDRGECCQTTICREIEVQCFPEECKAIFREIVPSSPINPIGSCEVRLEAILDFVNRPVVGYFWDFGDGTTGTSTSNSINHNFPGSGTYTVCVTIILASGPDECCTFTYCQDIKVICPKAGLRSSSAESNTGNSIEDAVSESNTNDNKTLGVFPNPGNDLLNVVLNTDESANAKVLVYNLEGREVMNQNLTLGGGAMGGLDVTALPTGVYVIQVRTGSSQYVQRWIKQ